MKILNKLTLQIVLLSLIVTSFIFFLHSIETGRDLGGMVAEQMVKSASISLITFYILTSLFLILRAHRFTANKIKTPMPATVLIIFLIAITSVVLGLITPLF